MGALLSTALAELDDVAADVDLAEEADTSEDETEEDDDATRGQVQHLRDWRSNTRQRDLKKKRPEQLREALERVQSL